MPRALPALLGLATALGLAPTAAMAAQEPAGGFPYEPETAPNAVGPPAGVLSSRRGELLGRDLAFQGRVDARYAGRPVVLQRREGDASFREIGRATAAQDGSFRVVWRTDHIGRFEVRAVPVPPDGEGAAAASPPTPSRAVTVFRPARATFFGPGFYGKETACGQRMTRRLAGIAHRTLPCGTLVDVYYRGRTRTVPVVDRGPFRKGFTWDLTAATARALGFETSDTIGAVRAPAVSS